MVQIRDPATGRTVEVERRPIIPARRARAEASAIMAARDKLAAAGGLHTFTGLYRGDARVRARLVEGKYGLSWLLDGDDALALAGGKKWVTFGRTSRQQKALGLCERPELDAASVHLEGRHVVHVRKGCMWGSDARLKFTMEGPANGQP